MTLPSAADVEAAAATLSGVVDRSPLQLNARLSEATGAQVWLKREDLQPVRSYKLRGAHYLISRLDDAARRAGVVCASAGNHGQGVAYACAQSGIRGTIFVPATTPRQKRDRMHALGGEWTRVVVIGDTYDEAAAAALAEVARTGATMVPAFDDARTIIGQGTVMPEIVDQLGAPPDVLVIPVGGGGMLAGCLTWLAERQPQIAVFGAEPAGAPSMARALHAGGPVTLEDMDTFVDGAAVRRVGALPYAIAARHRPRLVTVAEGRICTEMLDLYQIDGIIAEPAGALAPAALDGLPVRPGETVVVMLSGGNNDVSRYAEIVERSLVHQGRKHYFLVNFPQEPGALRRFLDEVLGPDDDIVHFEYIKRSNRETGPAVVGIELGRPQDLAGLLDRIHSSPVDIERIEPDSPFYRLLS